MPSNAHDSRVKLFLADLAILNPREIVRKHITTGMPVAISTEDYYDLRRLVSEQFKLHPSSVVMVGSCRTGFSIIEKPKRAKKRYRAVESSSDFDLAIVSAERFDYYWDGVFDYARSDYAWRKSDRYKRFAKMLFEGWIDPRGLPSVDSFRQAQEWTEFFDDLMNSRYFGSRRLSARLYRNWERLEVYQEIAVRQCISEIGRSAT